MRALKRLPIVTRLRRRAARLAEDETGASLIEFGLLFPIVSLFVLGTIDVGRGLATKFRLEQAAQRTIEIAASLNQPRTDYTYLEAHAAEAAGIPADNASVNQWLECRNQGGQVTRLEFTDVCPDGESEARYVEIVLFENYMPSFGYGPLASGMANVQADGSVRITAAAGVRVQ